MERIKDWASNFKFPILGAIAGIIVIAIAIAVMVANGNKSDLNVDNSSSTASPTATSSPTVKSLEIKPSATPDEKLTEESKDAVKEETPAEVVEDKVVEPAVPEAPAPVEETALVAVPGDVIIEGAVPEAVGPNDNNAVGSAPEAPAPNPGPLTGTLVYAGDAVTVGGPYSGSGTVYVTYTRDPNTAAPNLPVYTSMICDGSSVYSGAQNATQSGPVELTAPYAGSNCVLKTKVAYPSSKWNGSHAAVYVNVGAPQANAGTPSVTDSGFVSTPVIGTQSFTIGSPSGLNNGAMDIKLTACSSRGGTSDATRQYGCDGYIQQGVGSGATLTASDANGVLGSTQIWIDANTHHAMARITFSRQTAGSVTLTVTQNNGSAMLVHGPGTRITGTL